MIPETQEGGRFRAALIHLGGGGTWRVGVPALVIAWLLKMYAI